MRPGGGRKFKDYERRVEREGIHLRGFAQIDRLVAYKNEGFTMFCDLMASIWEEFTRVIFHVEVVLATRLLERQLLRPGAGGGDQGVAWCHRGSIPSPAADPIGRR